ncbi:MAG: hypothetical protein IJ282_05115 [Lachnospiraceae bacterium]|nr:hypothetical protein [Lachnospiraceae bacterium]
MDSKEKITIYRIVYIAIGVVISIPLACEYVMSGGDVLLWLAKVEELSGNWAVGHILSKWWLIVPALLRCAGMSITTVYRIYLLLIGVLTLFGAKLMFQQLFQEKLSVLFGVLFYVTCPYRLYVCYDKSDVAQMMIWLLVPFGVWAVTGICRKDRKIRSVLGAVISFAGICLLTADVLKGSLGAETFTPALLLQDGYNVGQFFSSWFYSAGHPGLGLGLLGAVLVLLWLRFTDKNVKIMKKYGVWAVLSAVMLVLSMGLSFCFGFASMALCVLGACGVEWATKDERTFVKIAVPLMIFMATIGNAVYMCNMLVYARTPMYLTDTLM